jgi:hypothetical protein
MCLKILIIEAAFPPFVSVTYVHASFLYISSSLTNAVFV